MSSSSASPSSRPSHRALVLGGGGAAGNAWLIGTLAGFLDGGLDVTGADVVIGTSAGATAAAQVTAVSAARLYADILTAVVPARPAVVERGPVPAGQLERTAAIIAASADLADMRRRMGAAALELDGATEPEAHARWRATAVARIPSTSWPSGQQLLLTAVDARSGEPVVFTRDSGVSLPDAIAASTAGGPAYGIGSGDDIEYFIDGGYRANADNADLAAGASRVLVLSPFGGATRLPAAWGVTLADQVAELRAAGSLVETVFPDAAALTAFGGNMMDLSARVPAAQAGFAAARSRVDELAEFWKGELG